jgi:hypothetical protein
VPEELAVTDPGLDVSLRDTVARQLCVLPHELTLDVDLDSFGLDDDETAVGLLEAVEHLLDVRFPDDFLDGLRTYGEFHSAVRIAVGV